MEFQPKSEDEVKRGKLLEAGIYDFEVLQAEPGQSKSGNEMIKLKIGVYGSTSDRISLHVYDYLLAAFEAKLRHFCDSVGLLGKYEQGSLCAEDCKGRSGQVKLIIEEAGQYPAKNAVRDYVCRPAKGISAPQPEEQADPEPEPTKANKSKPKTTAEEDGLPF